MTDDEDILICPGTITIRDFPNRDHPNKLTIVVQCSRAPGHLDDGEETHYGWVIEGVSVEWRDVYDGVEFDADSPLIINEVF